MKLDKFKGEKDELFLVVENLCSILEEEDVLFIFKYQVQTINPLFDLNWNRLKKLIFIFYRNCQYPSVQMQLINGITQIFDQFQLVFHESLYFTFQSSLYDIHVLTNNTEVLIKSIEFLNHILVKSNLNQPHLLLEELEKCALNCTSHSIRTISSSIIINLFIEKWPTYQFRLTLQCYQILHRLFQNSNDFDMKTDCLNCFSAIICDNQFHLSLYKNMSKYILLDISSHSLRSIKQPNATLSGRGLLDIKLVFQGIINNIRKEKNIHLVYLSYKCLLKILRNWFLSVGCRFSELISLLTDVNIDHNHELDQSNLDSVNINELNVNNNNNINNQNNQQIHAKEVERILYIKIKLSSLLLVGYHRSIPQESCENLLQLILRSMQSNSSISLRKICLRTFAVCALECPAVIYPHFSTIMITLQKPFLSNSTILSSSLSYSDPSSNSPTTKLVGNASNNTNLNNNNYAEVQQEKWILLEVINQFIISSKIFRSLKSSDIKQMIKLLLSSFFSFSSLHDSFDKDQLIDEKTDNEENNEILINFVLRTFGLILSQIDVQNRYEYYQIIYQSLKSKVENNMLLESNLDMLSLISYSNCDISPPSSSSAYLFTQISPVRIYHFGNAILSAKFGLFLFLSFLIIQYYYYYYLHYYYS